MSIESSTPPSGTETSGSHTSNTTHELALFDLDHTLLDVDSDYLWGEFIVKNGLVDEAQYRTANQRFYEAYIEGTLDAVEYNEFVADFLTTLPLERLYEIRDAYIKTEIEPHIRPKGIKTIKHHIEAGHDVVIISATNNFIVNAIAKLFGIDESYVLATPLEVKNSRYTGKLSEKPNFQEGKIYHLKKWLGAQEEKGITYSKTYAYSDSKNDLPLLEWADSPVAVTPDDVLRAHALAHHWVVEDWSL